MRDYQCTKNNPYYLPRTLYKRVLSLVRDYSRLKEAYCDILHESASPLPVQSKNTAKGSPTERKAIKRTVISTELKAIESALDLVPLEYRSGVFENICYNSRYPQYAANATYRRWKQRFLYNVAVNLGHM